MRSDELNHYPIEHGGIKSVLHPRLGVTVAGQSAVRYLRFIRDVRVDRLELAPSVYGRWIPAVPTHPAHLIVSILDPTTMRWKTVQDVDLPRDSRIEGNGLSQRMRVEQMEAHFTKVLKQRPHVIRLGGLKTNHLRVECDREHPVWPNHGETNGGEFDVPFGILRSLKAFGKPVADGRATPEPLPSLRAGAVRPIAPKGMTVERQPLMLLFRGRYLSVGFSLHRPMLLHLGWDALGKGQGATNRLFAKNEMLPIGGLSGPSLRTFTLDCIPNVWTGDVSVQGNRVSYRNLRCAVEGVSIDATFTVEPKRLLLQLTQRCKQNVPVIEGSAWRLVWDIETAMTGAAAMPTLRPGRNGEVQLPALWAGDGVGCLSCRLLEGSSDRARLQVESYRMQRVVMGALALGPRSVPPSCDVVPTGTVKATFELAVTNLEPVRQSSSRKPGYALRSNWSAVYSCFRPEHRGFSNQAISVNCHVNQHGPAEIVAFTRKPEVGPHPLDLFRFTIERALLDGGGYGYWRNLYLDSDPILLSAAGRIHQTEPNLAWLRRIDPGLREAARRVLNTIGKEGLAVCRDLSGNAGSYRWSSNAMDVVGFGHMDAYVNAWTYRGLRNAAAMLSDLGHVELAQECRKAAASLRVAFADYLVNPRTGWVVGWRSQDGVLHDYAFTWVNGPACAFGLLDPAVARKAMHALELLRERVAPNSGVFGIPLNLLPIHREDHMLAKIIWPTISTFERYTDGAMAACGSGYYLRALAICGLKAHARQLAGELERGYAAMSFVGGSGSGVEFRSWDGLPNGYEGTFVGNYISLYGIAIEQGLFQPSEPEWWPAGG